MRCCMIMLFACLHVFAGTAAQEVTLTGKKMPLAEVFRHIKQQTGYVVFYNRDVLRKAGPVTISVQGMPLRQFLDLLLKEQPLQYFIKEQTVVIEEKKGGKAADGPVSPGVDAGAAPPQTVSGAVTDSAGRPLPGASVRLLPGGYGTFTDGAGQFSFAAVPPGNYSLEITFIGFETLRRKVTVQEDAPLAMESLPMKAAARRLEEVAVLSTGYQEVPAERATGAFSILHREQLDKPAVSISQRLIGAVPGMQARLDENGLPVFEIRGQSSLNIRDAFAQPLLVVDGFPVTGSFSSINPNDVLSVTVLKDAAAASIWGAKAGNGVIVVTTKQARKNMPLKIDLSAFIRVGARFDLDYVNPLASSAETVEYEKMTFNRWGAIPNPGILQLNFLQWSPASTAMNEHYLGFMSEKEKDDLLNKLKTLDNRQQIRDNLLQNPATQQINLSLSGATGRLSNVLSLLYERSLSNFKNTENNRYMLHYRATASAFRWLDVHVAGLVQRQQSQFSGVTLSDIQTIAPYEMLMNEDGSLNNINRYYWPVINRMVPTARFPYADWTYNPIQEISNRDMRSTQMNARIQGGLTFKLMPGLTFDSKFQYETFNTRNKEYHNENTFLVRDMVNTAATWNMQMNGPIVPNLPKGGILLQSNATTETYTFRNQLNFTRRFADRHEVNFMAGSEMNSMDRETFGHPITYGYNDQTLTVGNLPNGAGPVKNWMGQNVTFNYRNSFTSVSERFFSLYSNLAYTFEDRYTLSGSYRTDASNLITDDPKYRYAPFWSAGIGWLASKERFLRNSSWLQYLNFRTTYGFSGNVDRSTAFKPLIAISNGQNIYTNEHTASVASYGNPTLRWEKTGTWNAGVDYAILNNKLFGKVDVYNKNGKDLIALFSIPAVNGTASQRLNQASMTNKGVEIELGSVLPIKGSDVAWRGSLNFSYNKNRITNLYVANYTAASLVNGGTSAYVEGNNANSLWMYEYAGVVNKQPVVKGAGGATYDFSALPPGDARRFMVNAGTTVAPYTLGMTNAFKLYDFDLSFIVTGKFGHVFRRKSFNYPALWTSRVLPNKKLSEVMGTDGAAMIPLPLNDNEPNYFNWERFYPHMSYLAQNASHLRLQEVNLTWRLPAALLRRAGMKSLRLYAQGNDLTTIAFNSAGEDPEYPLGTMNPRPKYTFGLQLEL